MVQPSPAEDDPAAASPASARPGARPRALPRVQALIDAGRDRGLARSSSWWDRLLEALGGLLRPPILRHAIAALRRNNLDAAFALLREEVKLRPGRAESAQLFWNVALTCQRADEAADAMARLVRAEAAENRVEEAANHWSALVRDVPDTVVELAALAKILPVLRARSAAARGETAQREAQELLQGALRRCVDPAHGALNPALALRIVEDARGIDVEVALRAARIALHSSGLHEAKRTRLEELVEALERGEWPEATPGAGPRPGTEDEEAPARPAPTPRPPRSAAQKQAPAPRPEAKKPTAKQAGAKRVEAKKAEAKKAETKKPAAAAPAPAAAASRPRPKVAAIAEESAPVSSGRRTVALTQDEIEAASSRLAERMAARSAQPSAKPAPTPARAPSARPVAAPVEEKEEPIAVLEQEDADAILEVDDANAILEVDAEGALLEGEAPSGVLEPEVAAEAMVESDDEPDAVIQTDVGSEDDFEFGGAALRAEEAVDFEIAVESELVGSDADAEAISDDDAGFAIGDADPEQTQAPGALSSALSDALQEARRAEPAAPALRALDIVPVEIGDDGLVAFEVASAQRTRVDYRAIEAVAAAEIEGLADAATLVALLVLRARPGRPRSALRMRCDAFDPTSLFPGRDSGDALRSMLADLLERTRAVPLPDPDSALAIQPHRFDSLAAFEAAVVARLPG